MASSISIRDLTVTRGDFCLQDINLDIKAREIFAILGKTGSGKTVLLESLAGVFSSQRGSITFDGKDARDISVCDRSLGIVYQDHALFPHMNVFENVAYGLRMRKTAKTITKAKVESILRIFDIMYLAQKYPGVMSEGELQRVALARALVLEPHILLLDEPFSALDPVTKKHMYATIRRIHDDFDCTIIFVTHDFYEAQTLAHRIGIILGGKLRSVVDADKLFTSTFDRDIDHFLGKCSY